MAKSKKRSKKKSKVTLITAPRNPFADHPLMKKGEVHQQSKSAKKPIINKEKKIDKYQSNYNQLYNSKIIPSLMNKFNYSSVMEVPKIKKITLNMGIGDAKLNSKALDSALKELTVIAGQKAVITLAKKDVSNFKIRHIFFS